MCVCWPQPGVLLAAGGLRVGIGAGVPLIAGLAAPEGTFVTGFTMVEPPKWVVSPWFPFHLPKLGCLTWGGSLSYSQVLP